MTNPLPEHIRAVMDDVGQMVGVEIISVLVRGQHKQLLLEVYIDARGGVTHENCRDVSAALDERLGDDEWYGRLRAVEVSSPGADAPVRHLWQLAISVGRSVRVVCTDDTILEGTLAAVDDEALTITVTSGKGKERSVSDIVVSAANILEARVILSFR